MNAITDLSNLVTATKFSYRLVRERRRRYGQDTYAIVMEHATRTSRDGGKTWGPYDAPRTKGLVGGLTAKDAQGLAESILATVGGQS